MHSITFSLSLMDPLPSIDILVRVSSCSLFNEFPRGPRSLPTKLNCRREKHSQKNVEKQTCHVTHTLKQYGAFFRTVQALDNLHTPFLCLLNKQNPICSHGFDSAKARYAVMRYKNARICYF